LLFSFFNIIRYPNKGISRNKTIYVTQFLSIFLLFSLIFPTTFTYLSLKNHQHIVKKEIKKSIINGIEKNKLTLLIFSNKKLKELKWKHDKEFEYKNLMYDIVYRYTKNDSTFLWCWPDNKETALNKQLNNLLFGALKNNRKRNNTQKLLDNFFKNLYNNTLTDIKIINISEEILLFIYKNIYINQVIIPDSPPPKLI
jgi:hypothetical protein